MLTRRLRRAGEGVRIDVAKEIDDDGAVIALATLMPEAGRVPLSGPFLRLAVEAAVTLAEGVALRISSPAVTPAEARGFADAGFVTTSELHLLTHDLTGSTRSSVTTGVRLRRGSARDTPEALRVDAAAFAPGWTMSAHGLANARGATPITSNGRPLSITVRPSAEAGDPKLRAAKALETNTTWLFSRSSSDRVKSLPASSGSVSGTAA